tara:strand:+ start:176 stop:580 length:405 start_codon:yes stop_codon:yes gene_type:complete
MTIEKRKKVKLQFNQLLWGNHENLSSLFYYVTSGRKYIIRDDRNPLKYGTYYNEEGAFSLEKKWYVYGAESGNYLHDSYWELVVSNIEDFAKWLDKMHTKYKNPEEVKHYLMTWELPSELKRKDKRNNISVKPI